MPQVNEFSWLMLGFLFFILMLATTLKFWSFMNLSFLNSKAHYFKFSFFFTV